MKFSENCSDLKEHQKYDGDSYGKRSSVSNFEICRESCQKFPWCKGWSFDKDKSACKVMSHIGELEKSKDWISGTKFCGGEKIVVSLASIIEILFLQALLVEQGLTVC